ncbi:MAG: AarF/ABC1/UbiB kinase family protein [Halanaerobiales bacterium]|nr:AarF/ABC1/UbiB kinase family protein [Halanaerobiales bacterium]
MPLRDLNRRYRHIQRYRQIVEILIRNGFGFFIEKLDLYHMLSFKNRVQKWRSSDEFGLGKRLRKTLEELGPTFVKFGQMLSTRSDIFPEEVLKELEKLQDKVHPVPTIKIHDIIFDETNHQVEEIFLEFLEEPLAAGSIGQVHKAKLFTGEEVVVKVQRPGIHKKVKVDLEILTNLAGIVKERMHNQLNFDPVEIIKNFSRAIIEELDYHSEGRHAERFSRNFNDNPNIKIPKIYWKYTTQKILVMEYIIGTKVTEFRRDDNLVKRQHFAKLGAESFFSQILLHGFFHGDPHPGNIMIIEPDKIAYLDFGLMGELDDKVRDQFAQLFVALVRKNTDGVVNAFLNMGMVQPNIDEHKFKKEIGGLIEKYYDIQLMEIQMHSLFDEIMEISRKHSIYFPSNIILLVKATITLEGVAKHLEPSFNLLEVAKPFAIRLIQKRLHPGRIIKNLTSEAGDFFQKVSYLPEDLHLALQKILNDNLKIRFQHENLQDLASKLDIIINRLVMGLIVSSLFVGSSLTIQSKIEPLIQGVSSIGFAGYVIAGILGIWLVISILRSGRF